MNLGLNDNTVKRIAAVAYHNKGNMMKNLAGVYQNLTTPETINQVANAHMTDAMQHRFSTKDEENSFKVHLAKSHAINRGLIDVPPASTGQESV